MNNKLVDLNNHLFAQLERLTDEELEGEALEIEIKRSKAVTNVANSIIHNASTLLSAHKHSAEYASSKEELPNLLSSSK